MFTMTESGYIFIAPDIEPDILMDVIGELEYKEEFCVARSFSSDFIEDLMFGGFLVMSASVKINENEERFILLPKHHLLRNVLFFDDLHISKTIKRLIKCKGSEYELCVNRDYDEIIKRCIAYHGDEWLTKPLIKSIGVIRRDDEALVEPCSFELYHNGVLCAGEFGVKAGAVYTSYSGYHDENSSGIVQMVLTAQYLQKSGFLFWDFGMPLAYKYTLGARDVTLKEFIAIFRAGRDLDVKL
jgi:Leu/Phe-tRNA-protein transferase